MESTVRTIYGADLSTCKLLNKPYAILENTTLNQKFNVASTDMPAANQLPSIAYMAIGNRGSKATMTTSGQSLTDTVEHLPRHAALYGHIPFIMRKINEDLTATERLKYRMRVPFTKGTTEYVVYYLKTLDLATVKPAVELRSVESGTISTSPFKAELSDLSPVPAVISSININKPDGDYLVSTAKVSFNLSQSDIVNIIDACMIMYGDARLAKIDEMAICSGVDRPLTVNNGGVSLTYTEAIAVQVVSFLAVDYTLKTSTTYVDVEIDIGSGEGLHVDNKKL